MNFKEAFYKNYASTHTSNRYGLQSLQSITKEFNVWSRYYEPHLPKDKKAQIIDIGCGLGSFVYFLRQLGYEDTIGVDISSEQIELGKGLGIRDIYQQDVSKFLQITDRYFDCVIARDVIEHFTRQEAFDLVTLIVTKLKPGGRFIMQVPNGEGIFVSSIFYGDYTHEVAYTDSSVRQLFLNCGFAASQCYPTGPITHNWKGRVRKILWSLKVAQHKFWKMVETGTPAGIFTSNLVAVGVK